MLRGRILCAATLVAACSGTMQAPPLVRAQRCESTHDVDGAQQLYAKFLEQCPVAKTRDDCGSAATRSAELFEASDRPGDAFDRWLLAGKIAEESRTRARGLVRAAQLAENKLDRKNEAEALCQRVIAEFPGELAADDALRLYIRILSPERTADLDQQLAAWYAKAQNTDLGDNLLFERAELKRATDVKGALELYDSLAAHYSHSSLRDEALYHAAEMLRANRDYNGAVTRLETLLRTKKDAWVVGSYNSVYLDDAQLLLGHILRDDLKNYDRAAKAFLRLGDAFKDSVLADDGLWEYAKTELQRPDVSAERKARACKVLHRIVADFPDSNQHRHALDLAASEHCSAP